MLKGQAVMSVFVDPRIYVGIGMVRIFVLIALLKNVFLYVLCHSHSSVLIYQFNIVSFQRYFVICTVGLFHRERCNLVCHLIASEVQVINALPKPKISFGIYIVSIHINFMIT